MDHAFGLLDSFANYLDDEFPENINFEFDNLSNELQDDLNENENACYQNLFISDDYAWVSDEEKKSSSKNKRQLKIIFVNEMMAILDKIADKTLDGVIEKLLDVESLEDVKIKFKRQQEAEKSVESDSMNIDSESDSEDELPLSEYKFDPRRMILKKIAIILEKKRKKINNYLEII